MRFLTIVVAVIAVLALGVADADAAKRSKGKKKYRSKPVTQSQTYQVAGVTSEKRDNATLCDGGMMITADDQIKGCTALISSGRLNRERKATAFYNRGNAYVGKSDFSRAIGDYTDALSYKSDYGQAYFNRAVAHRLSGNAQLAVADYTSALALMPQDADALTGRAIAYVRMAQHEKALADLNQALAVAPGHMGALVQRGHHHVRTHRWALAAGDYDAALSLVATSVEPLYGRGVAKTYLGDVKGGQMDMAQAMALDSGVTARMTSQGIPPPQILSAPEPAPIVRKPKEEDPKKPADAAGLEKPAA